MAKPEVIVLFGGPSGERRVSVASAQNVTAVLPEARLWFSSPDGKVFAIDRALLLAFERPFERDFIPAAAPAFASMEAALDAVQGEHPAFFVGCMHGTFGENGALQHMLEARGLAFTGSGSEASARAFDKVVAKNILRTQGARVADSVVLAQKSPPAARAAIDMLFKRHGRIIVKRVADGSSVGLHHVRTLADVETAAAEVANNPDIPYMAEVFMRGRELTVGVIEREGGRLYALSPSEVVIDEGRAFDFEGKYLGKGTREITPVDAEQHVIDAAQNLALDAHRALGCRGYTRTDMIVTMEGPVYLETNTLPGLTKASFIPQQLAEEEMSLGGFFSAQLDIGVKRLEPQE